MTILKYFAINYLDRTLFLAEKVCANTYVALAS